MSASQLSKEIDTIKKKGRPPGSKNSSRNNSRSRNQSPLTSPNKY